MTTSPSRPYPLGATLHGDELNVAVASEVAEAVELCLFDDDGGERRVELPERDADVFHGRIAGVVAGQRYGLRVHGPWDPKAGLRCNPAKLLIDPYARAVTGDIAWDEAVYGHTFADPEMCNDADSAPYMPRSVVVDSSFDWAGDRAPRVPLSETIIYETHVRGLTKCHPAVPEEQRGTYAGLRHPAVLEHLTSLGVTSVELLPIHLFAHDNFLVERGLRNYWGYSTVGFFAPHHGYAANQAPGAAVAEFKETVKALHAAGLEVILDVVYNHTAEGNHLGPTLSLKGIDNPAYYRLVEDEPFHYFDTTGTGNSFNVSHPFALQLILDSLRYWVSEMHVDGFRFDLATALTRQMGEQDIHSAFLSMVHQDPVLSEVKLIAEPWDVAGYQLGGFPARWSEWNGKFRDTVRDFWRGTDNTLGELALRMTGSGDLYSSRRRAPTASVNFVTAHDGFTLADLTSYDDKHNEANGDDNTDGESDNRSWNCGVEGPTNDPEILALRARQRRNLLGTLLLSAGVPMLLGGDELGRTQSGNNNGYCQDNEISWYDWSTVDHDLLAFVRTAIALRRDNPALRPREYLRGPGGEPAQMVLYRTDGQPMADEDWQSGWPKALAVALDGRQIADEEGETSNDRFLLLLNGSDQPVEFTVPPGRGRWHVVLTTDDPDPQPERGQGDTVELIARSMLLLHSS